MINAIAGILLVLVAGLCVVAFPFVLWMLFGGGVPRRRRHTSRPRGSEDNKKAQPPYDEAEEEDGF
jgi:hypothetical protein